jgi:asparagine N-glycosylation enzyme membrane subunit Stt3
VVAHANLGHAIQNVAHRPTPTDPFWAFIGVENWSAAIRLLGASSEPEAVALAHKLKARYVITTSSADPETVEGWLHYADGTGGKRFSASEHFRLVAEGPARGIHFSRSFQLRGQRVTGPGTPPYKLFERVEGAVLEVRAAEGEEVIVTLRLASPSGRRIDYETRAIAGADGVARLRVPYATGPPRNEDAVAPEGPYRVRSEGGIRAVTVSEADVQQGAAVPVVGR